MAEGAPLTTEERDFLLSLGYSADIIGLTPTDTMRRNIAAAQSGAFGQPVAEIQARVSEEQVFGGPQEIASRSPETAALFGFVEGLGEAAENMASKAGSFAEAGFKGVTGILANAPILIAGGLAVALIFLLKR